MKNWTGEQKKKSKAQQIVGDLKLNVKDLSWLKDTQNTNIKTNIQSQIFP